MLTKGDGHIGRYLYLKCASEFSDAVNDLRQTSENGYVKFERCTVSNAVKGAGTWIVDNRINSLLNERTINKESTGFTNCENITVTYNSTTRKITLTGTFEAYYLGEKIDVLTNGWESSAHADVHGLYFLRYCETGFEFTTTPWTFDCLQIAFVSYNTHQFGIREVHGFMQWQNHKELHEVIGTYRTAGGGLTGITLNSTTAADRRPDVAATTVEDEDLKSVVNGLSTKLYTQRYLSGSTPTRLFNVDQSDIIALNGNIPYYNQNVGGTWQQTPIPNNNYAKLFYVAVPVTSDSGSQSFRYMWVQPQTIGTLAQIQAVTTTSYYYGDSALFISEFVFVGEVIINVSGNNWTIYSTALLSGTKLGQIASPTGNFLTTVNHDSSLTGSGTSGDPLSVVGSTIDMTTSEFSGSIDETNDKFIIYDFSLLKWIRFSFTNLKSYLKTYFDTIYQAILVSGTNIKTINNESILGSGNLTVTGGGDIAFSVPTRIENTSGNETLYNPTQRTFYLLDITNSASTYTVTISRKPSSGGTAAFTNVEHYVLIRNTAAGAKTLVVQLETTGDKMDSEGLTAVAIPASGIYEIGYIWVQRGTDNLCIITKSTLLSEITK